MKNVSKRNANRNPLEVPVVHAIASNLVGFRSTTLRVVVTRFDGVSRNVWVTTADLLDVGTRLVLDASQVKCDECEDDAEWCCAIRRMEVAS